MTLAEHIARYRAWGLNVIPLGYRSKKPALASWRELHERRGTEQEVAQWFPGDRLNVGIVCGRTSGNLVVPDFDNPEPYGRFAAFVKQAHGASIEELTPVVRTGGGGGHRHVYLRVQKLPGLFHPQGELRNTMPDIQSQGGYVVAPPSLHPDTGEPYEFVNEASEIWEIDSLEAVGITLPSSAKAPVPREPERTAARADRLLQEAVAEATYGDRNHTGFDLAKRLRDSMIAESDAETVMRSYVEQVGTRGPKPYTVDEALASLRQAYRREPRVATYSLDSHLTDAGNAQLFAGLFGDRARFDHRRGRWLLWNGHRWAPDIDGQPIQLAIEAARQRFVDSVGMTELDQREKAAKWAIASESRMRIEACLALARTFKPIADSGEQWDSDRLLLGVANGVVDLRAGTLRPGKPDDRITLTTGVAFDPDAQCPRWESFQHEVFRDPELEAWVRLALGYSVSGEVREQGVFLGHGDGANGKAMFVTGVRAALGDYAYAAPFSTFELYQRATIPNDLAALEWRRFVTSSETTENTRLNEARVKAVSGCDPITARYLHAEFFTFEPHLKLWLFVNHKPKVIDDSFGFWRRVRLIPFTQQFKGEGADQHLAEKLRAEAPGILAWLVWACLDWQRRGLEPVPDAVRLATEQYRWESDRLSAFINEKCIEGAGSSVKASKAYEVYREWAENQGLGKREVLSATTFGRSFGGHYSKERREDGNYYVGVGVRL